MGSKEKIQYESFKVFMQGLEYDYEYKVNVFRYKFSMEEKLRNLKREVLSNLISLNTEERKAYLNHLRFEVEVKKEDDRSNIEAIEGWYKKYNSPKEDDIAIKKNRLYNILTSDPPTFAETLDDNFNDDILHIQHDFYNYYFGFNVDAALQFIDQQLMQLEPPKQEVQNNNEKEKAQKLKFNLSVEQVAFLFKMLDMLKPDVIDKKSKAELFRWISASIETKKSKESGISVVTLRNEFSSPDLEAVKFWETHLRTLITEIKKFK